MRVFRSFALAVSCLLVVAAPVAAHSPTSGAVREYSAGSVLSYRFGSTSYPSWVQSAVQSALGPDWSNPSFNNSRLPTFNYSSYGYGLVYYSSSPDAPCQPGNMQWLQCASNWGSPYWRIYIRNFSGAPYSNWRWCDTGFSGTCWDTQRAFLHETGHVTMAIAYHDAQGESNTVMASGTPWYPNFGWNTHHIQRCDEAAGQLLTGMASASGPVADCFDHIYGHGAVGLIPAISPSSTFLTVCLGQVATLSGRFAVSTNGNYQAMSNATLGGRMLWFDRRPHGSSMWTANVAAATSSGGGGTNWSRSFSTGATSTITYDFLAHTASEAGLDGGTSPIITVTWRTC